MRLKSEIITNYMKEKGISLKEMADMCKISVYLLKKLIKGEMKVNSFKFFNVVDTIGCKTQDFFEEN